MPVLILIIFVVSFIKKSNAFDLFIEGAVEGISLFVSIFTSLLAMIFIVNLLNEVKLFEMFSAIIAPITQNIPDAIIPMCMFRPISGGAAMAIMVDLFKLYGPDSLSGMMASVIQGSTDTTFYVLTLYFSSVGIKKIRNAIPIGLFADAVGITVGILLTIIFFS